jgi:hypothetical protein
MLMKVFAVTVPNPYLGEGSKSIDRVAPPGETRLSYFTVFARGYEDARLAFVEFCGRGRNLPTLTSITPIGEDSRVLKRAVVPNTPTILENVEVESLDANQAKALLREFISNDSTDPLLAMAIRKVTELDEFVAFKGLKSTLQSDVEVEEVPLSELQALADETADEVNQKLEEFYRDERTVLTDLKNTGLSKEKLSFIERLTSKRGG